MEATLSDIALSVKTPRQTVYHWAVKAGKKISPIKRKLGAGSPHSPAVFTTDEIASILTEGNAGLGMLAEEKLNAKSAPSLNPKLGLSLNPKLGLTFDQKVELVKLTLQAAELFERTTPGASADYCLNWAKKRLSGRGNGDKYQPTMNLIEQDNPGENNND